MNSGEKQILKTVMQTQRIIVGGQTYEETVEVGSVVRARPGPVKDGAEYIMLVTEEAPYRWDAPLDDWSESVDDDPANESRWVEA